MPYKTPQARGRYFGSITFIFLYQQLALDIPQPVATHNAAATQAAAQISDGVRVKVAPFESYGWVAYDV